jgi:molybdopterin/thiamine biosynthesis adenylyltransferase
MTEIVISVTAMNTLLPLLNADVERGAALYLSYDAAGERYLVQEVELAGKDDCLSANEVEITFAPQFLTRITKRARQRRQHLALLHTHPSGSSEFSGIDDSTEQRLADFMQSRNPEGQSFSLILCDGRIKARCFGTTEYLSVRYVGAEVVLPEIATALGKSDDRHDRQIRAFGEQGQAVLRSLTVAIVGLGGTGSVAAQQLAHLGVGAFVLIDSDVLEVTNLNRVVGAQQVSVGRSKVEVTADLIRNIQPHAHIVCLSDSVISERARQLLCKTDCIFVCTDSHVSRAFLSEFAFQYLVPAFDVGVSISTQGGRVSAVTGRTQMLAPGLPCLLCSNALDARVIREELMTPEQRAADPYFNQGGVKQPAVISINSTMVSLAVTMFLAAFTGIPVRPRWQSYDALSGSVRVFTTQSNPECPVCGAAGNLAAGDSRPLSFLPH